MVNGWTSVKQKECPEYSNYLGGETGKQDAWKIHPETGEKKIPVGGNKVVGDQR